MSKHVKNDYSKFLYVAFRHPLRTVKELTEARALAQHQTKLILLAICANPELKEFVDKVEKRTKRSLLASVMEIFSAGLDPVINAVRGLARKAVLRRGAHPALTLR